MENKKEIFLIIILLILLVIIITTAIFYNRYNKEQLTILNSELNKMFETDLKDLSINYKTKTERNYEKVENSVKDYICKLKNIYVEMNEMSSGINPNVIFSAQNLSDKKLDKVENIINEYKEKSQELISEYTQLIDNENILKNIQDKNISIRKEYYINLYKQVMLSDAMEQQYIKLDEDIKNEKGKLYEKLNKVEKMRKFLEENEEFWTIEGNKIQFKSINKMTDYYNLFNQIVD